MAIPRRVQLREASQNTGEVLDDTPVELSGGGEPPLSLRDEMRRFVRQELSQQQAAIGEATFEDEDDFTEDEDTGDLVSAYTVQDLVPEEGPADELEGEPNHEDLANVTPAAVQDEPIEPDTPPAKPLFNQYTGEKLTGVDTSTQ